MSTEPTTEPAGERDAEAELRARVAELEAELADRAARTNAALAAAQDRTYWLDRWHLDLNAMMRRPMPARLWRLMPAARAAYRAVKNGRQALAKARLKQRLGGGPDETGERVTRLNASGLSERDAQERLDELRRTLRAGDRLELSFGAGDALSPEWLLGRLTGAWKLVEFIAGGADGADLYVLDRR